MVGAMGAAGEVGAAGAVDALRAAQNSSAPRPRITGLGNRRAFIGCRTSGNELTGGSAPAMIAAKVNKGKYPLRPIVGDF